MNKEQWIDGILQVSKQVQPAASNPFMATRIEAALLQQGREPLPARLSLRWVWLSAALMAALAAANVLAWSRPLPQQASGIQSVMQEYGLNQQRFYSADF
jgi:hypothetical protein